MNAPAAVDLDDLQKRLQRLGYSPTPATLGVLHAGSASWLSGLLKQVEGEAGDSHGPGGEGAARLKVVVQCAGEAVQQALSRLGATCSLALLVRAALANAEMLGQLHAYAEGDEEAGQTVLAHLSSVAAQVKAARKGGRAEPAALSTGPGAPEPAPAAASTDAPTTAAANADSVAAEHAPSVHVYGGKGALCFSVEQHPRTRQVVLMLDAAEAKRSREFDWHNKLTIQLTTNEMLTLFAVLVGLTPAMETAVHGIGGRKLRVDDQESKFYVRLSQAKRTVAVPMEPMDALQVALLISNGMLREQPHLVNMEGLMNFVRLFIRRLARSAA